VEGKNRKSSNLNNTKEENGRTTLVHNQYTMPEPATRKMSIEYALCAVPNSPSIGSDLFCTVADVLLASEKCMNN
jgi:hypothetical protein